MDNNIVCVCNGQGEGGGERVMANIFPSVGPKNGKIYEIIFEFISLQSSAFHLLTLLYTLRVSAILKVIDH